MKPDFNPIEQLENLLRAFPDDNVFSKVFEGVILDFMGRNSWDFIQVLQEFPHLAKNVLRLDSTRLTVFLAAASAYSPSIEEFCGSVKKEAPWLQPRLDELLEKLPPPAILNNQIEKDVLHSGFTNGVSLVVGVADYQSISSLPVAVTNDANDFEEILTDSHFGSYLRPRVRRLLNNEATLLALKEGLKWVAEKAGQSDTVIIYFSGHGAHDLKANQSYLLPYDADLNNLTATALSGEEFRAMVNEIKAQKVVVILDSCHSGGIKQVQPFLKFGLVDELLKALAKGGGKVVLSSCKEEEVSLIAPAAHNSVFTTCLLEGMKGAAGSSGAQTISIYQLFEYIGREIKKIYPQQNPVMHAENASADFPIMLNCGGKTKGQGLASAVASEKTAILVWRRKLEFLEIELAKNSDAAQKFSLQESIDEAKKKILDLSV